MKNRGRWIIALIIIIFICACGNSGGGHKTPPDFPPVITNAPIEFSCLGVNNEIVCSSIEETPGIWNSGAVQITGSPMPMDFMNVEVVNNGLMNAAFFIYSDVHISGCWDGVIVSDAITLMPGDSFAFSELLWNYRCGMLGYQDALVSIYNAVDFDSSSMNPINYPRTDLIANAIVHWDNRLPGDMP